MTDGSKQYQVEIKNGNFVLKLLLNSIKTAIFKEEGHDD